MARPKGSRTSRTVLWLDSAELADASAHLLAQGPRAPTLSRYVSEALRRHNLRTGAHGCHSLSCVSSRGSPIGHKGSAQTVCS